MSHALLGPSSSHRWINCPPSALLNAGGSKDTPYTREGTIAHALAENKLHHFLIGDETEEEYDGAVAGLSQLEGWNDEMRYYTDVYLDAIRDIYHSFPHKPYVAVEQQLNYSQYVPDGYGTADCIMVCGDRLHVIDFKYGKGVAVSADHNSQMMLYGLGATIAYAGIYDIDQVDMTIIQPRIKAEPDTFSMSAGQLHQWARETVAPAAALAVRGEGEFAAGDWCRFCAIRATCRTRAAEALAVQDFGERLPPELTDEEVGRALTQGRHLADWLKQVEDYALKACLEGRDIAGYKAVASRATRTWTDQPGAFAKAQEAGIPEAMLYDKKPIALTALEKIMGKKAFEDTMKPFITIPPGKPTLVPDTDKRPAITGRPSVEDDFEEEE